MTSQNDKLQALLGITLDKVDKDQIINSLVESFIYHEGLADSAISAINTKSENFQVNYKVLWDSFETNNIIAYTLRSILLTSVPSQER